MAEHGGWMLRKHMRREWERVAVIFSEEKREGRMDGFWYALCDANLIPCLSTESLLNFIKIMWEPGFDF